MANQKTDNSTINYDPDSNSETNRKYSFSDVYGLTGNSGSGKSTATNFLRNSGAWVVSADEISKKVSQPGGSAYKKIIDTFGPEYLNKDKTIDNKKLHRMVFNNKEALSKLESIIHPLVKSESEELLSEIFKNNPGALVFYETPLLFEKELNKTYRFKKTIYISAPQEISIHRIMQRDSIDEEQAKRRLDKQLSDKEKKDKADIVIENTGTKEEFIDKINKLLNELRPA